MSAILATRMHPHGIGPFPPGAAWVLGPLLAMDLATLAWCVWTVLADEIGDPQGGPSRRRPLPGRGNGRRRLRHPGRAGVPTCKRMG